MDVCCECCVLSGRGLYDELIIPPEESYRLWPVVMCDLETSWMRRPWPTGAVAPKINIKKQTCSLIQIQTDFSQVYKFHINLFSSLSNTLAGSCNFVTFLRSFLCALKPVFTAKKEKSKSRRERSGGEKAKEIFTIRVTKNGTKLLCQEQEEDVWSM